MNTQHDALAANELSEGLSGAEIVAVCRNAALLALEAYGEANDNGDPMISMSHIVDSLSSVERQITADMIEFYDSYRQTN